ERREELVLGHDVRARQGVEQGALAGVGVADDGYDGDAAAGALGAPLLASPLELLELSAQPIDPLARTSSPNLELRLAGAAAADAAGEPRQGVVLLPEAREDVLHLSELDLQLAVSALRPLRE